MKKIFVLCFVISSLIFANDQFDIIEDRIENQFVMEKIINLENYSVDYDIDIFNNQMNIEIEVEGLKQPNLDFKHMKKNISKIIKDTKLQINDVYIVVKYESLIGNDVVLFSESYLNM